MLVNGPRSETQGQSEPDGTSVVVWKVGGSLLTWSAWPRRFLQALRLRGPHRPLLLLGGGEAADIVRRWDRLYSLGDEPAHWLALASLGLNERLAERLLPDAVRVPDRPGAERAWQEGRLAILAAADFVASVEPTAPIPLPHNWDVTSDSVAAWVAAVWPAGELVLVKSTGLEARDLQRAAEDGLTDAWFPQVAGQVPTVRWLNLRDESLRFEQLAGAT